MKRKMIENKDKDWYVKVYGKKEYVKYSKMFYRLRHSIYKLDDGVCQSCFRKLAPSKFSVHHIVPLREGGKDVRSNLILLCLECHDKIEGKGLNRMQITGYYYDAIGKSRIRWAADFHRWVYGADENPYNDDIFVNLHSMGMLVQVGDYWYKRRKDLVSKEDIIEQFELIDAERFTNELKELEDELEKLRYEGRNIEAKVVIEELNVLKEQKC